MSNNTEDNKIIIITSDNCSICKELPKEDNVKYIDINSEEAKQYNVTEVPTAFVGGVQCTLMKNLHTGEIFVDCPE